MTWLFLCQSAVLAIGQLFEKANWLFGDESW
jgi:hypothetical protein